MCVIVADIEVDVDSSLKGLHQTSTEDDKDQEDQNNWLTSISSVERKTHIVIISKCISFLCVKV